MADEKQDPWQELFDAIPHGWIVGRPPVDSSTRKFRLYGYERRPTVTPAPAVEAEADSEEAAVREMARKLREAGSRHHR